MKLCVEPTSFSERKATSFAAPWRVANGPPGSKSGACWQGFPRNLGGLVPSRRGKRCGHRLKKRSRPAQRHRAVLERTAIDDGYAEVKATKPKRMGSEKSETADSTDEGGEPTRRDPLEGSGSRRKQACGGKDGEDIEPRGHLNATTQDSDIGPDGAEEGAEHVSASHR